jgi:peptide/nickel transport system substrate-binding protein
VYDTLLRYDQGTATVVPWLAVGFTLNPTATQMTLKLRPGVKFGSGDVLDADAVVAAQRRYLTQSYATYAVYIKSMSVVNPTTVEYDFSTPWAQLPTLLTQGFGMIADQAVVNRLGAGFAKAVGAGAGVGPFEVASFNPPSSAVLKAKSDYWGGPVCLQQITFTVYSSTQQAVDSFLTGQYTTAFVRDPVQLKRWEDTKPRVGTAFKTLVVGTSALGINNTSASAHLNDVRVRQAIQYASDVKAINQRGFQGTQIPHANMVPIPSGTLKPTKALPYNLQKARALLNQVKSETGWDGSMGLTCVNTSADYATAIAAVLDNAGFKINADSTLPAAAAITKVNVNRDFDLACGAFQVYGNDYWSALSTRVIGTTNLYNFHNTDMDAAVAKLAALQPSSPAYQPALNAIQKLFNEQVPFVIQGSYNEATLVQNNLKGLVQNQGGTTLYGGAYLVKK